MGDLLKQIEQGQDIRQLDSSQINNLCGEIRDVLIETVSRTGGHLASNLGVVELTVVLHRVFDVPNDSLLFDVGHQCYVHKMLTGRYGRFDSLRQKDGLAGFPKPAESDCDPFIAGHSSTALSNGIGLARAKILNQDPSKTIVVLGDGAFANGMVYEAINSVDPSLKNLVVILNDNSMSISKSVGAIAGYLLRLRTASKYAKLKKSVQQFLTKLPFVGTFLSRILMKSKSYIRRNLYGGTLFEELGFNYVGTVDGHNTRELDLIFNNVKAMDGPLLVHVITTKGKGFVLAEENPGAYHGVGQFDLESGNPDISCADSFSNMFGKKICTLSDHDEHICAVTAAMKYATGLHYFYRYHRERFFDVGIAEEHAVTFCAGLARGGKKPVLGVYSTFLQRAFDQLAHDIAISQMDLMIGIDRAGLVGEDGETHQGLLDVPMLSSLGAFTVASPCNYAELEFWTERLMTLSGPRAIRYPRGSEDRGISLYPCSGSYYDIVRSGDSGMQTECAIITYGREFSNALCAVRVLQDQGIECDIVKLNIILPISDEVVNAVLPYKNVVFAEEGVQAGGIAEQLLPRLIVNGYTGRYRIQAIDHFGVPHATVEEQMKMTALDGNSLAALFLPENPR